MWSAMKSVDNVESCLKSRSLRDALFWIVSSQCYYYRSCILLSAHDGLHSVRSLAFNDHKAFPQVRRPMLLRFSAPIVDLQPFWWLSSLLSYCYYICWFWWSCIMMSGRALIPRMRRRRRLAIGLLENMRRILWSWLFSRAILPLLCLFQVNWS